MSTKNIQFDSLFVRLTQSVLLSVSPGAKITFMLAVTKLQVHSPQTKHTLPVLLIDIPHSQSITTMFLANTGSRYEQPAEAGLAHFFEHMVFKGTNKFPTSHQLSTVLDSVGADFNAFTSKEYTGYYVRSATAHFDLALDVLSDMLFVPTLRQSDIDREKGVILEEINMYVDNPASHVANVFEQATFADQSMAHPIVGSKDTIQQFTRADFERFLKRFYGPENLLLIVAGGVGAVAQNQAVLQQKIQAQLGKLLSERSTQVNPRPTPSQAAQNGFSKQRFSFINRQTEQAHFVLAWPSLPAEHPDRYALQVLSAIVGGNMSSRLFSQVREERGLAYYVHSDLDFFHDLGLFGCSAGVDRQRVPEAVQVSQAVFTDLLSAKGKVKAAELRKAKDYLRGKTLLSLESSNVVAQFFGLRQLLRGEYLSVEEVLEQIDKVTLADLQRVAAAVIVPQQARLAVIGDFAGAEKLEQLI